ncbi:MAG: prepilin-type N-terminal cleavage/methylation domain-containing protein [Armatimonadota bacterium]
MHRRAFTLIELLVVIAIIAILAAILFPVFAQAKLAAKKTVALSNAKETATATFLYKGDYDDSLCQTSWESALTPQPFNPAGKYQIGWTYLMQPYIKNWDIFTDPGDPAPTTPKFPCPNGAADLGKLNGSGQMYCDWIAQKYSYIPNYNLMPAHDWSTVSESVLDDTASTIAFGLRRFKLANGTVLGQHKGLSGFNPSQPCPGSTKVAPQTALLTGSPNRFAYWTVDTITPHLNDTNDKADVIRVDWARYNNQAIYAYADGHAKVASLSQTLNPDKYQYGDHFYPGFASYNTGVCAN